MVRPKKHRCIQIDPNVTYFKPRAVPMFEIEQVNLELDELEAIRLKDHKGFNQKISARKMKISISTFQRILNSARKKIASALVSGKAIAIKKKK